MKLKTMLVMMITLTGCQKQQDDHSFKDDNTLSVQFEKSDAVISSYLDKLDSPRTSREEKIQILCKDYPAEYNNYMPTLLKSANNHYTKDKLLSDLKSTLDFYKTKENIRCE